MYLILSFMGRLHLITGSFEGKVGKLTGQQYKGHKVIKAAIDARIHLNFAQTMSVRAFECVNRIAGSMSRHWARYLPRAPRNMLLHNSVARMLKPLLSDHVFTPENWLLAIRPSPAISISAWTPPTPGNPGAVTFFVSDHDIIPVDAVLLFVVCDGQGYCGIPQAEIVGEGPYVVMPPEGSAGPFYLLACISYMGKHGKELGYGMYITGGGMQYSTTPQLTGDMWFDGRPIWVQSIVYPSQISFPAGGGKVSFDVGAIEPFDIVVKVDTSFDTTGGWPMSFSGTFFSIDTGLDSTPGKYAYCLYNNYSTTGRINLVLSSNSSSVGLTVIKWVTTYWYVKP